MDRTVEFFGGPIDGHVETFAKGSLAKWYEVPMPRPLLGLSGDDPLPGPRPIVTYELKQLGPNRIGYVFAG